MNTFRAKLLPCAGTAGGASPQARAAGQSIIVCGNLSARRPGGERTRKPVRLPAERQRLGAVSIFKHAGRRLARRDLGADAFARVQGFGGRQATTGHRTPISFLGSARVQACQQTPRRSAQTFHFLTSIGRSFHEREGSREDLSWMTRNVTGIAKCL